MKRGLFDRAWLAVLCGYIILLCFTIGYCYWCETPQSASPLLLFILLVVVGGFVATTAMGALGIAAKAYWRGALLLSFVLASVVLLLAILGAINRERSGLALAAAVTAVKAKDASGLQTVQAHNIEVYTHFIVLRMKDGRSFSVTLDEKGRTFHPHAVVERESR